MKHGRNPTRKQKERIEAAGLNPDDYYVTKDCADGLEIVHRETDERMWVK